MVESQRRLSSIEAEYTDLDIRKVSIALEHSLQGLPHHVGLIRAMIDIGRPHIVGKRGFSAARLGELQQVGSEAASNYRGQGLPSTAETLEEPFSPALLQAQERARLAKARGRELHEKGVLESDMFLLFSERYVLEGESIAQGCLRAGLTVAPLPDSTTAKESAAAAAAGIASAPERKEETTAQTSLGMLQQRGAWSSSCDIASGIEEGEEVGSETLAVEQVKLLVLTVVLDSRAFASFTAATCKTREPLQLLHARKKGQDFYLLHAPVQHAEAGFLTQEDTRRPRSGGKISQAVDDMHSQGCRISCNNRQGEGKEAESGDVEGQSWKEGAPEEGSMDWYHWLAARCNPNKVSNPDIWKPSGNASGLWQSQDQTAAGFQGSAEGRLAEDQGIHPAWRSGGTAHTQWKAYEAYIAEHPEAWIGPWKKDADGKWQPHWGGGMDSDFCKLRALVREMRDKEGAHFRGSETDGRTPWRLPGCNWNDLGHQAAGLQDKSDQNVNGQCNKERDSPDRPCSRWSTGLAKVRGPSDHGQPGEGTGTGGRSSDSGKMAQFPAGGSKGKSFRSIVEERVRSTSGSGEASKHAFGSAFIPKLHRGTDTGHSSPLSSQRTRRRSTEPGASDNSLGSHNPGGKEEANATESDWAKDHGLQLIGGKSTHSVQLRRRSTGSFSLLPGGLLPGMAQLLDKSQPENSSGLRGRSAKQQKSLLAKVVSGTDPELMPDADMHGEEEDVNDSTNNYITDKGGSSENKIAGKVGTEAGEGHVKIAGTRQGIESGDKVEDESSSPRLESFASALEYVLAHPEELGMPLANAHTDDRNESSRQILATSSPPDNPDPLRKSHDPAALAGAHGSGPLHQGNIVLPLPIPMPRIAEEGLLYVGQPPASQLFAAAEKGLEEHALFSGLLEGAGRAAGSDMGSDIFVGSAIHYCAQAVRVSNVTDIPMAERTSGGPFSADQGMHHLPTNSPRAPEEIIQAPDPDAAFKYPTKDAALVQQSSVHSLNGHGVFRKLSDQSKPAIPQQRPSQPQKGSAFKVTGIRTLQNIDRLQSLVAGMAGSKQKLNKDAKQGRDTKPRPADLRHHPGGSRELKDLLQTQAIGRSQRADAAANDRIGASQT